MSHETLEIVLIIWATACSTVSVVLGVIVWILLE